MSFTFLKQLPTPEEIKQEYALSPQAARTKLERDQMVQDIITGKSSKFLVIIGPCSADNEDSVYQPLAQHPGKGSGPYRYCAAYLHK